MISKGTTRGSSHQLRCDDAYFSWEDDKHAILAVFDGCSSSKHGNLGSQLMANAMESAIVVCNYLNIKSILRHINLNIDQFIRSNLGSFNYADYRSTLIIALIDKVNKTVETINIGDGLIFVDEICYLNSDDNVTEYMVDRNILYNMENCNYQKRLFEESVAIATDGLNSFKGREEITSQEVFDAFIYSNKFYKTENFVQRTCRILQNKRQVTNYDDLTIVRYESDNKK